MLRKVPMVQKCVGVVLFSVAVTAPPHLPPLDRVLPSRAEVIDRQMVVRVDPAVAMDTARMMAPLWRLAGNPAFEQSQQFIFDRLAAAGLAPRYETFTNSGMGWEQRRGTLRLGSATGEVLLSHDTHHVALAINSFARRAVARRFALSTPAPALARPATTGGHSLRRFQM